MPQAPATRPPITMMATWLAAPMIRSTIPRPSAMAPATGPSRGLAADAGDAGADGPGTGGPGAGGPGAGGPGAGGTGLWGAYPRGAGGTGGKGPWGTGRGGA